MSWDSLIAALATILGPALLFWLTQAAGGRSSMQADVMADQMTIIAEQNTQLQQLRQERRDWLAERASLLSEIERLKRRITELGG